jgi:hypothetical protein
MLKLQRPIRVLAVNDYNFDHAYEKVHRGIPVRHHLWGIHELQHDPQFEVRILPFSRWQALNRLASRRTGDIDQQLRVLCNWGVDVVYAANYNVVMGLGLLRRLNLFRRPIVVAGFTIPPGGRLSKMMLEGFSHFICLSSMQMQAIQTDYPQIRDRFSHCVWGWDEKVRPMTQECPDGLVLSAGKTMRDYQTFLTALQDIEVKGMIVCPSKHLEIGETVIPANCELVSGEETWALQDNEMSDLIRHSAVIAIPLQMRDKQPHGLTSLLEAMAHGKPVLMTRNPYIDIDIEGIGCGYWIEPGSVDGWRRAIWQITRDPRVAAEMGAKGRIAIETTYSIQNFANHLKCAILSACRTTSNS